MQFACIKGRCFWIDKNSRNNAYKHNLFSSARFLYQECTTRMMCNMQFYPHSVCVIELLRDSLVLFPFYSSNKILLCIDLNRFVYFLLLTTYIRSSQSWVGKVFRSRFSIFLPFLYSCALRHSWNSHIISFYVHVFTLDSDTWKNDT